MSRTAPTFLGAFCCLFFSLLAVACEEQQSPDWGPSEPTTPLESEGVPTALTPAALPAKPVAPTRADPAGNRDRQGIRFASYNVENWLTMERRGDDKKSVTAPKPEVEKEAVVAILVRHQPDVIGVSEIGAASDLADLQQRLEKKGLKLPHLHYASGADPVRRLGLLSRFPITATARPSKTSFRLQGREFRMNRGILDATIRADGKDYRFLGVHLKSKREDPEFDQNKMRIQEAHLLRQHVDTILAQDPAARLIVYGDFNDTRPSAAFRAVTGSYNTPSYLTALPAKDRNGHSWTHFWRYQDIYSRIDFIAVSNALKREVDFKNSYIVDDADWNEASDHRPIIAIFR